MKRTIVSAFLACSCVWAQSGLSVEAFDEQSNNNSQLTLRLRLKNNTAETLKNIQAKYLIERDDSRKLNVHPYYMPNATFSLDTLSNYLVVNINIDAVAPGFYPNESGISLGMVYSDGQNFYKETDYSYPGANNFNVAPHIIVMQNGAWVTGELPYSMTAAKLRFKAIQPENSDTRSAWVEIENYGKESVNLSRFVLKNSESHNASIGDFTLKHGEKIRICQDITLECPADDFSTVIQNLTFGNAGEIKLALGSKTVDYVAWGKQGTMGDSEPLPTKILDADAMYESYYIGAFFRYIDNIGWKIYSAKEIKLGDNHLPFARDYNMPDGSFIVLGQNQKPRFSWVDIEGADSYTLNVYSSKDKSLVFQKQTNLNYAEVDLPSGSYLWSVVANSDLYGYTAYGLPFEDEMVLYEMILDKDEEFILQNKSLIDAPSLGARKDTRMLATNWGYKADDNGWNKIHKLSDPINAEEKWRCWAVAFNVLNRMFKGTLTQDEIKILGMKYDEPSISPLFYFYLNEFGGGHYEMYESLFYEIFHDNAVMNHIKSGYLKSNPNYEEIMKIAKEEKIDVSLFKKNIEAGNPIFVAITNPGGSGHVMVVNGYATSDRDVCSEIGGEKVCFVKKGDPLFHFVNTDNNGGSHWINANAYRYKFYYVVKKPSYILNRDPLLNDENNDADNDGVIAYDEVKRFGTDPDKWDYDNDGISDFNEIYAMVNRCTNLKIETKTGEIEVGCRKFEYYDSDGDKKPTYLDEDSDNGGVIDGAEDLNGNGILDAGETDPYVKSDDKKPEVAKYKYDLPNGITLFGATRVAVNDYVQCFNTTSKDGPLCDVASAGENYLGFSVIVGARTTVNNIYSRGKIRHRNKSVIAGNINIYSLPGHKNLVEEQDGAIVKGKTNYYNKVAFPYSTTYDSWEWTEEPTEEITVKNGETLEWDSNVEYKKIKVEAGGKLVLNPGEYHAKELILDDASKIQFAKPGESTLLIVTDKIDWRPTCLNDDREKVARGFKLVTFTQDRLFVYGSAWTGTLYAPNTYIVLGQASNKVVYGRILGDVVIIHQTTVIHRVDYDPIVPEVEEEEEIPDVHEEDPDNGDENEDPETVVAENENPSEGDEPSNDVIGDGLFKQRPANENVVNDVVAKASFGAELKGFSRNGIVFETKSAGIVKISIMSANGMMVNSVSTGNLEAGKHSVAWNSENVPSGRYLVTLSQNGKISGKFATLR